METPGVEGTEKEYLGLIVASVQKGKTGTKLANSAGGCPGMVGVGMIQNRIDKVWGEVYPVVFRADSQWSLGTVCSAWHLLGMNQSCESKSRNCSPASPR